MIKFSKESFMKPILSNLDSLKSSTINKFVEHITSHSFVVSAVYDGTKISISFSEPVVTDGVDIAAVFMKGGIIRKINKKSEDDVFVARKYA